eukprot:912751-Pleurochrysis_carterae.AAC.1
MHGRKGRQQGGHEGRESKRDILRCPPAGTFLRTPATFSPHLRSGFSRLLCPLCGSRIRLPLSPPSSAPFSSLGAAVTVAARSP